MAMIPKFFRVTTKLNRKGTAMVVVSVEPIYNDMEEVVKCGQCVSRDTAYCPLAGYKLDDDFYCRDGVVKHNG